MAAQRFGRKLSLIVTDLDHFKAVNDTYGHAAGDRVLKELGEVLRRVKRETDLVARFGGEEFCVLCEETDVRGAQLLAERVREELEKTEVLTELGPLKVTASLGVATFPRSRLDRCGPVRARRQGALRGKAPRSQPGLHRLEYGSLSRTLVAFRGA